MKRACLFLMLVHVAVPAACDSLTRKKPKLPQVHAFTLGNTLNGGLVGALGPSMATFASSTGLNNAALARTIMLNRAAKPAAHSHGHFMPSGCREARQCSASAAAAARRRHVSRGAVRTDDRELS